MKRVVFTDNYDKSIDELLVIELGITYKEIRQLLDKVRKDGNFEI